MGKILNIFTKDVEFKIHVGTLEWKYLMMEIDKGQGKQLNFLLVMLMVKF